MWYRYKRIGIRDVFGLCLQVALQMQVFHELMGCTYNRALTMWPLTTTARCDRLFFWNVPTRCIDNDISIRANGMYVHSNSYYVTTYYHYSMWPIFFLMYYWKRHPLVFACLSSAKWKCEMKCARNWNCVIVPSIMQCAVLCVRITLSAAIRHGHVIHWYRFRKWGLHVEMCNYVWSEMKLCHDVQHCVMCNAVCGNHNVSSDTYT